MPEGIYGQQARSLTALNTLMETRDTIDLPWLGVILETEGEHHSLFVNWETACRGPLLRNTEFQNTSPKSFNSIAGDSPCFKEPSRTKRHGNSVRRYALFEWEGLL
jgi:hypothetical protein